LLVQKRTKKGHHGDHPEGGSVAQIIPTWPSTFGIALTVDLQPHSMKQKSAYAEENAEGHAVAGMKILVANAKKISLLDFSAFQQDCQGGGKHCIFLEFLSPISLFKQRNRVAEGKL